MRVDAHAPTTWAGALVLFVMSAFAWQDCPLGVALQILKGVLRLSPSSAKLWEAEAVLHAIGRRRVFPAADAVMECLPDATCGEVAARFKRLAMEKPSKLAVHIAERYGSLFEEGGDNRGNVSNVSEVITDVL